MYPKPKITKNAKMNNFATTRKLFRAADWRILKKLSAVKAMQIIAATHLTYELGNNAVK